MQLKNLKLLNFKNYEASTFEFIQGINCIVGSNGTGKTNLLDAIHYLSMTKSGLNSADSQNIRHGESFFTIIGNIQDQDKDVHEVFCSLKKGAKKNFRYDQLEYERLSEHIGKFPSVLIAPNDTDLIQGGNSARRKFFDSLIAQIDQEYLQDLIHYNHNLKQRNSLLKYFRDNLSGDQDLIKSYDLNLVEKGERLFNKRTEFLTKYQPIFEQKYDYLTDGKEHATLGYVSQFAKPDPLLQLQKTLARDIELQRTTFGTHKDEWLFDFDSKDLKKFGSQGQQKSYLISLKIAQFDLLSEIKGFSPILLLDDIFDKLDDSRIEKFMHLVSESQNTQVFITDARPERTKSILKKLKLTSNTITISKEST
jgi:DNA replication and repair protein RecF